MAEYIERGAVMLHIAGVKIHLRGDSEWISGYRDALQAVGETVQRFPAADVKYVIRSKWEITNVDHAYGHKCYHCPECGCDEWRYEETNFCPNCGADMRGADHDND